MNLENQVSTLPAPADTLRQQQMQQQFSGQKARFISSQGAAIRKKFRRIVPLDCEFHGLVALKN
jgi:hypothetical protein